METYPVLYLLTDFNRDLQHKYDKHRLVIHEPVFGNLNIQTLDSNNAVLTECPNCLFRYEIPDNKTIYNENKSNKNKYCNYCLYLNCIPKYTPTSYHPIKINNNTNNNTNNTKINNDNDNCIQELKLLLFLFFTLFLSITFR